MGEKRHLQVEYQLNAAVRAVALDAREYLHTLASDTHPLGALESPAAELQDAARVRRLVATARVWRTRRIMTDTFRFWQLEAIRDDTARDPSSHYRK